MALLNKNELNLTEYAAETMVYFERHKLIEITKKILVECALIRPQDAQEWIGRNIKRIANEIYQDCLNGGKNGFIKSLHLSTNYLYRIMLFGRPGSGRKTQAYNLVSKYNVVLIDAEMLIYQHLRGDDNRPYDTLDRELQRAFYYNNCAAKSKALLNIIAQRVLEKDCLNRGWILLNFPHTLQDFKDILENFKLPPNKLFYLKCPEMLCMRRLINMHNLGKPSHTCSYYEQEMRFFNKYEDEILNYLLKRHETIVVDAQASSEQVKMFLLSSIIQTPHLMGFKRNTRD
ncbi:adenylate kinase 8 [Lucilia cuprina]|uniref:adenylate kinase 8 n=1 Tax=Lucilia cuprina TaxID=7375 RepID=UPI001F0560CB|nr:adenylate kinase 8 [Lucilia cuprina]